MLAHCWVPSNMHEQPSPRPVLMMAIFQQQSAIMAVSASSEVMTLRVSAMCASCAGGWRSIRALQICDS